MIIETCPVCGRDLLEIMLCSNPPIPQKQCLACGWSWTEKHEEATRVPFGETDEGILDMVKRTNRMSPVLCNAGGGAIHHHYWGCPVCSSEVGGFVSTGSGEESWTTHQDKFCHECGQKIDWSKIRWEGIYRH